MFMLLLANELYQINRNTGGNNTKSQFPIKKIFYKNNQITLDKKKMEEYGSESTQTFKQLQNWLQMPLNTINTKRLNLPDFRTGAASANPYIEIYCTLKTNKALETKLNISIGKKPDHMEHVLDLANGKITSTSKGKIVLKLDKKNYFIDSETLFSKYVKSEIIDEKGVLNIKKYDSIIQKFLEYAKKNEANFTKIGSLIFRIYILPSDSTIEYKQSKKKSISEESFIDYFGNTVTCYASSATKTAKFLTFDDRAFTINCTRSEKFYKNLGIGEESHKKIYVDASKKFNINRLDWTFVNISDPDYKFTEIKKGILTQLYENYKKISKDKGITERADIKIICIKTDQAKQEILIDENLTMDEIKNMFLNIDNIPKNCLEIFIDGSGQKPIWNTYLYIVKNFLAGNKIPKNYVLSYFTKILKQNQHEWIKPKNRDLIQEFFKKSDFCLKSLFKAYNHTVNVSDTDEGFAEKIGQITRLYVDFKDKNGESNNSLSDILTYSKYDRDVLRFITSRISRGIHLSKISDDKKKDLINKITSLQPKKEIADGVAPNDFSYFFFKGFYTKMEIVS